MPVKIIICDDTAEDAAALVDALNTYDQTFHITVYKSGGQLLAALEERPLDADLLFLDIYMPGVSGIFTAQRLRALQPDLKIIFVSSSNEHYPEAYDVFAFNYLLKPLDPLRLGAVLERALGELRREAHQKISLSYKGSAYSVDISRIVYIESRDKLSLFHMADGSLLKTYKKLDQVMAELPEALFIRCHQSFIVNTTHIIEMGESYFRVEQTLLGISRKYMKSAKDHYYAHLFAPMGREAPG